MSDTPPESGTASTASTATASQPTYANNPDDPTTWSPDYAAQRQAATAAYQAQQMQAANAATLAQLQPCAELAGPAFANLMAACKAAAPNVTSQPLATFLQNLSTVGALTAAEFSKAYAQAGGTPPAS